MDLAAIRDGITSLVGNQAIGMVKTTIREVEKGHFPAMKYLFEMIGFIQRWVRKRLLWIIRWPGRCCAVWGCRNSPCWKIRLRKIAKWNLWWTRVIP